MTHLNLNWSIADIDALAAFARRGYQADEIAHILTIDRCRRVSADEILRACELAGIDVASRPRRGRFARRAAA